MAGLVLRLEDDGSLDPQQVGPKLASLARAHRDGFSVPPARVVTAGAERRARGSGEIAPELEREILEAARELGLDRGLAVRSSATLEDLEGRSFAGVYESFLDVRDETELLRRVADCWSSSSREAAIAYRDNEEERPAMAVILQRMVTARFAGVAFSRDPQRSEDDVVLIEAVPGLGEALVAGHVTPLRARMLPTGLEIETRGAFDAVDESSLRKVAELARRLESQRGAPQDVEWAIDEHGELWLLQARPITTGAATPSAPAGAWTREIAVDLWGDALTPFLAEAMVERAPRFDLSRGARFVGIETVERSLAVISGYLYVNVEAVEKAVAALPPRVRTSDLAAVLPPGRSLDGLPSPTFSRLVSLALRAAFLGVVEPRANLLLTRWLSSRDRRRLVRRIDEIEAMSNATAKAALERVREALELLTRTQESNQWPYYWATVTTLGTRAWLVDRQRLTHGEFLAAIGGGDNVTAEMERRFDRLASRIAERPSWLEAIASEEGLSAAPAELRAEIDSLLADYGCRGRHRALDVPRWAEVPEEVITLLLGRAKQGPAEKSPRPRPPAGGLTSRAALAATRRFLDLREELRFFLDRVLFLLRRCLLELGEHLGVADGVFFLRFEELEECVESRASGAEVSNRIERRRRRHDRRGDPPAFYVDGRPVELDTGDGQLLVGTGTSAGRATGRARIVDDPTRVDIEAGDVLVARHTDPGWTPVLRSVAAIVVEEGGLLNHCSIVARELGIPAVVGIRGATHRIAEGARITVDGSEGAVRWEDTSEVPRG